MSPPTANPLLLLALMLTACGDTVRIIECPPGTRPEGSECLPLEEPDTSPLDTGLPDTSLDTNPPDTGLPDTPETVDTLGPDDTSSPDTTETPRPTGSPCVRNADCAGGTCLDWTGGYCTRLDCAATGCGAGETCLSLLGNTLCVKDCVSGACPGADQACKPLLVDNTLTPVCVGVDLDAGPTGAPCQDPTDCQGAAACLASFPGGYCASLGCPNTPCAAGSTCVRVDGVPSCLETCSTTADCGSTAGAERRCGVLASTSGAPVDVCISGIEGKTLGASCGSDFECSSGTCQVLGEGRCSQTQAPCFTASVATDCNGAEFCQVNNQTRVAVCSQPCSAGRSCTGAAHCLTESKDPQSAWCRPACQSATDTSCNAAAGLACTYGIPVSDSGQGRYACALQKAGTPRATCSGDAQCAGQTCIKPTSGPGYCAPSCGADDFCPFGGACVHGNTSRCMRACFSGTDCQSGFACEFVSGATRDVCDP